MKSGHLHRRCASRQEAQSGYIMIMILVALALMVIAMTVAAPKIAQQVKREREEEMIHRGTEYARAVKKYFHKFNRYPTSIEQLENTNNIRFLRKKYTDPMNPDGVWRIVRIGEVQLNQPLNGASGVAGNASGTGTGSTGISTGFGNMGSGMGTSSNLGSSGIFSGPKTQGSQPTTPASSGDQTPSDQDPQASGTTAGNPSAFGNSGGGQSLGSGQPLGGGAMLGVASLNKGKGIHEFNNKAEYAQWFFIYVQAQDRGLLRGPYNPKAIFGAATSNIPGAKNPGQLNQPSQQQLQQQQQPQQQPQQPGTAFPPDR